jgi:hypothetical protein
MMIYRDRTPELVQMNPKDIAKISINRFAEKLRKSEAVLFWQHLDENPTPSKCSQACMKRDAILLY